jgi:endonuclease/exonuclease/phosphatase family metal-dependent hydrolase
MGAGTACPHFCKYWKLKVLTNRNIIILLIIFAVSMSASAETAVSDSSAAGTPIRVMSYNIFYDKYQGAASATDPNAWNYTSGKSRKERVINMIMSESRAFGSGGPDILGVQEAVQNQADDLQMAMAGYSLSGLCGKTGCEACRIFYRSDRFTKLDSGTFWLSQTPEVQGSVCTGAKYPRIACWVILNDLKNHKSFFVLNTHWDFSQEPKCYSAQLIRKKIKELAGKLPVIVMGDLNTQENEPAYSILVGRQEPDSMQLTDTHRFMNPERSDNEATFHGWKGGTGGNRIDYIFHNDGFYTVGTTIERGEVFERYPSDHYPVTAAVCCSKSQ